MVEVDSVFVDSHLWWFIVFSSQWTAVVYLTLSTTNVNQCSPVNLDSLVASWLVVSLCASISFGAPTEFIRVFRRPVRYSLLSSSSVGHPCSPILSSSHTIPVCHFWLLIKSCSSGIIQGQLSCARRSLSRTFLIIRAHFIIKYSPPSPISHLHRPILSSFQIIFLVVYSLVFWFKFKIFKNNKKVAKPQKYRPPLVSACSPSKVSSKWSTETAPAHTHPKCIRLRSPPSNWTSRAERSVRST